MTTEEARKLFVAGLPDTITEDILRQLFEATGGTVVEVSLPKDRATGRPRGFGFVTLSTSEEAEAARDSLDGSMQAGKSISVRPFQAEPPKRNGAGPMLGPPSSRMMGGSGPGPRGDGGSGPSSAAPDRTIYVGNLPFDATQEEVEALFNGAQPGSVVKVTLPTDEEGRKRGFGFVTMSSADTAQQAVNALVGTYLRGRYLRINLAHPKGERPPPSRDGGGFNNRSDGPPSSYQPRSYGGGGPSSGMGGGGGSYPPAPPPPNRGGGKHERRQRGGGTPSWDEGPPRKKSFDRRRDDDWGGGGGGRGGGGRFRHDDWDD